MSDLAQIEVSAVDGVPVVRVVGEIDLSNAGEVRDAFGAGVPDTAPVVILDLSGTTFLDSAGIAMIFRLSERLGYGRQELRLIVPPDAPIRTVIRLTQLDRIVPVEDGVG